MVQANKEAKKLVALLDGDSDTYVKNDCRADKWFIIELSQVAKIQRVELHQVGKCTCCTEHTMPCYLLCQKRKRSVISPKL